MKTKAPFAKIFTVKDGRQCVMHVDLNDEQDHILQCVTTLDGAVARIGIGFGSKNDERLAYAALENADQEFAELLVKRVSGITTVDAPK